MMRILVAIGAVACLAGTAEAAQIGVGDFTSPTITGFGNPAGTLQAIAEPKTIGSFTFSTASGSGLRWFAAGNGFANCDGGCITTDSGGTLNVALDQGYALAGLYVGQSAPYSLAVSFFNGADGLLGTVNVSSASTAGGVSFAGWQSDTDKVASISVTRLVNNSVVIAAQSGYLQANAAAVPEPATWAMMIGGFGLVGGALRRRNVRTAASFA